MKAREVEITCDECVELFLKKESRIKYSKNHFCGVECSDRYKKKSMKGENNPMFGKSHSQAWKEERKKEMQDLWAQDGYRSKVLVARKNRQEKEKYPFGWSTAAMEKRRNTVLELYGFPHNWSNKDCREKCETTTIARHGSGSLELARKNITKEVVEKRRKTLIETMCGVTYGEYEDSLPKKDKYYKQVKKITEKQPLYLLENNDLRAHIAKDKEAYHLDHIVPIIYGFLNNISPEIIGDISNLRFIPWRENLSKSSKYEKEV